MRRLKIEEVSFGSYFYLIKDKNNTSVKPTTITHEGKTYTLEELYVLPGTYLVGNDIYYRVDDYVHGFIGDIEEHGHWPYSSIFLLDKYLFYSGARYVCNHRSS